MLQKPSTNQVELSGGESVGVGLLLLQCLVLLNGGLKSLFLDGAIHDSADRLLAFRQRKAPQVKIGNFSRDAQLDLYLAADGVVPERRAYNTIVFALQCEPALEAEPRVSPQVGSLVLLPDHGNGNSARNVTDGKDTGHDVVIPPLLTNTLTKSDLAQFTGSDNWYRHSINRNALYTDGALHVAEHGGAYWLLDEIVIIQPYNKAVAAEEFQVRKLAVRPDRTASLTCDDGDGNIVFTEIEHTDFPLDEITRVLAMATDFIFNLPCKKLVAVIAKVDRFMNWERPQFSASVFGFQCPRFPEASF